MSYELKTTTLPPGRVQKANERVLQSLNQTYKADDSSFQGVNSKWHRVHLPHVDSMQLASGGSAAAKPKESHGSERVGCHPPSWVTACQPASRPCAEMQG